MTPTISKVLLIAMFVIGALFIVTLLVDPRRDRVETLIDEEPHSIGAAVDTDPDAAMAPLESAEGAVGTVALENAGAAVNPIVPYGAGGPAGQTPAYGQPGGVPSMVRP